jgi:uncharacterized protein YbbC (DUF1343 family)/CubicO group peptidase (beta-lactamase class C family)
VQLGDAWLRFGALLIVGCAPAAVSSHPGSAAHPSSSQVGRAPEPQTAPSASATSHTTVAAAAGPDAATTAELDALVAEAIGARKLPGCVVAIGDGDGVQLTRAYGDRALVPQREAMTEDTVFDLASLTKPLVTASAVMRLVDDRKLRLDDRASRYVKALDRHGTRAITVRQLLLHTAGLPHVNPIRDYEQGPRAALAAILAVSPATTPGSRFLYSDIGYLWLGQVVERAAGEPLAAYVQRELFQPLGMNDTRFAPPVELLARIAPTEITDQRGRQPVLIRGVAHDPRAYRLGGMAGHAGLFSTARDLTRFARMLLGGGALDGTRVLSEAAVAEMTRPVRAGDALRALGWDVRSEYSRLRGTLLSERAFGHGGYTGTSLWIDPSRDLFVLFLSNRVHPDGKGNVIALAGAVADAAVRAFAASDPPACAEPRPSRVLPGIDVAREDGFAALRGKRIGLVTHLAARGADGASTLDVLANAPGVELTAIFSPEHGLEGKREGAIADARHPGGSVPVYSLFGRTRKPTAEMMRGVELLAVDLVDVGARFYTYMSTLQQVLRAAAEQRVPVVVLDRPNPLGGVAVEGPVLDDGVRSFVNYYALPVRHGMTAGELATLIAHEEQLAVELQVIAARGWRREQLFEQTGLRWAPPSPNLPRAESALLYPAVGLLESTNLSVGRGTDRPFEQIGAPWIDAGRLVAELKRAQLPGVRAVAIEFTPARDRYAGERCRGVRLQLTDATAFKPVRTGLEIARALIAHHREQWEADKLIKLLGHAQSMRGLLEGAHVAALERGWEPELARFRERRAPFLRYPRCR